MPMFKANITALETAGLRHRVVAVAGGAPAGRADAEAGARERHFADASAVVKQATRPTVQPRRRAAV